MSSDAQPSTDDFDSALALAVRAPSLHNTQPWRFTITSTGLYLYADRERQLPATDLDGHALLLGCGAALQLARLGLRVRGWDSDTDRFPEPSDPDMLARVRVVGRAEVTDEVREQASAASRRSSERRPFRPSPVPDWALEELRASAAEPGVYLDFVIRPDARIDLAVAAAWANSYEQSDEGYRAELKEWTTKTVAAHEGVPPTAIPHPAGPEPRHTEVPIRDFEAARRGEAQVTGEADEQPAFAVLFTETDDSEARLRAGEALARVLVCAERLGMATSLISQPVDFPGVRERVRALMSWVDHPRMVLRIGWPPEGERMPPTPRREVEEVTTHARQR